MSYVPHSRLLHGVPYAVAECYGKPHVGCSYAGRSVASHHLLDGAACACCGRPAANAHHWPPRGTAPTFGFRGRKLRPALIAVCGSGTTGCHGGWHGEARFRALWRWEDDRFAEAWWSGSMLSDFAEHDPKLYAFGWWELYDLKEGRIWTIRE